MSFTSGTSAAARLRSGSRSGRVGLRISPSSSTLAAGGPRSTRTNLGSTIPRVTASGTSSLTWRIFLGAAGVVAAVLAATLLLGWLSVRRTIWGEVDRSLDRTRQLVVTFLKGDERGLARGAAVFVQNPNFRALLESAASGDMLDQSR